MVLRLFVPAEAWVFVCREVGNWGKCQKNMGFFGQNVEMLLMDIWRIDNFEQV